jgi:hypothetical protein
MDYARIAKHCRHVEGKLFAAFEKRKQLLLDVAREFYPAAVPGLTSGVEDMSDGYQHDDDHRMLTTMPMDCMKRGAAGFHGNLTSPTTPWFRFKLPDFMVKDGETTHEQRKLLDNITQATRWTFSRSNAYPMLNRLYKHLLTFGFGCMTVVADDKRIARVTTLRVGTYALGIGDDGQVDTCVRRFAWTAAQIIQNFGRDICPQYIVDAEKNPTQRFEVCNLIEPNATGDAKKYDEIARELNMSDDTVYRSIFWLKGGTGHKNDGFLRAIGFSIKPIVAPRMECEDGDIYGLGPGIEALDLARGCQSFKFDELNIVGRQSEPAVVAADEMKDEGLRLYRGAVNYARFGEQRAAPVAPVFPNPPGPEGAREERADATQEIARLFFNDAFSVIDAVRRGETGHMTATEVEAHVREAMQRLAPVATLFDTELLDPLVSIMAKYTVASMPTPLTPEQARQLSDVDVEYVSAIHLAQKQSTIAGIQQIFDTAATMATKGGVPEALYRVDADKMLVRLAELIGCPESCLKSDEEVAAAKEAAKKAAEEQARLAQTQVAADAAKNLGSIPMDENHAGSRIAAAMAQNGGAA